MTEEKAGISRRSVLKGAALGGVGLAGGSALLASCGKKKVTGDIHYTIRGNLSDAGAKINIAVIVANNADPILAVFIFFY